MNDNAVFDKKMASCLHSDEHFFKEVMALFQHVLASFHIILSSYSLLGRIY